MTAMFFEDFAVGQEYALPPVTVTMERMLSFARQYDPLPLHLDAAYAETTVFGGLIAPGIMSFMIVWAEFEKLNLWGDNFIAGKNTKIEWFAPVYAGDVLAGVAAITKCDGGQEWCGGVEVRIDVRNQNGFLILSDTTELVIKRKG